MAHLVLIVLHAASAIAAFGLGCALMVRLPAGPRSSRFRAYASSVWLAVLCLGVVVALDWATLPTRKRVAFGALSALAAYLVFRTEQARRTLSARSVGWRKRFVGHIGFVLISLFDGFCIVLAIDLRMPPAVIVLAAVFGVAAGVVAIRSVVRRESGAQSVADPVA